MHQLFCQIYCIYCSSVFSFGGVRGLHLIKDGVVALSDAGPLSLPGDN